MEQGAIPMEITEELISNMGVGIAFRDIGGKINSLDFNQSEDLLVAACDDESIRLFDTENAKSVKTIPSKKYGVDQICFTHHDNSVVCSSKNGWDESLRYLDMNKVRYVHYFKGHRDRVVSLCMSPDSDFFLSGALDHSVRLWDLRCSQCQGLLRVHGRPVVAYDQQGLVFTVSIKGGALKLFDARYFEKGPFKTFYIGDAAAEVSGIKFNVDGKLILVSTINGQIYVLDAYSGNKTHVFNVEPNPDGGTLEASFSPDGQFLMSGSGDGTLRAWNALTGAEIACWTSNTGVPAVVKWDPRHLMFASASGVMGFWIPEPSTIQVDGDL